MAAAATPLYPFVVIDSLRDAWQVLWLSRPVPVFSSEKNALSIVILPLEKHVTDLRRYLPECSIRETPALLAAYATDRHSGKDFSDFVMHTGVVPPSMDGIFTPDGC